MRGYDHRPNYVSIEVGWVVLAAQLALYNLRHLFDVSQLFSVVPGSALAHVNMRMVGKWLAFREDKIPRYRGSGHSPDISRSAAAKTSRRR
jgi:hypothetical protein